jgi:methionyl-tRNA formyltransferase
MRILLLGHHDIASNVALALIVAGLPGHRLDVRLSGEVAPRVELPALLGELAACEAKLCDDLGQHAAARRIGLLPFEELASSSGGSFGILPRPNEPEGLEAISNCAPELVISVRYRRILRTEAIAIPRHGVLNLHSGLLPAYKGMMATFWAMLNGEPAIGSTLHYIVDAGIDTGPVIGRAPLPADRQRTYLANVLSLYPPGCAMVVDAVRRIEAGESPGHVEQPREGRYYSLPETAALERFQQAGLRLFDGSELDAFVERIGTTGLPQPGRAATGFIDL